MKILRIFRLVRVFRLLREYGVKNIARSLLKDRAGSALLTLLLMGILVLEFGSLEILHVEQNAPGANITSASDALWYVIVTISTVGYGDRYPVTNEGRSDRLAHHRRRRRHLRHLHRLPGEPLPLTVEAETATEPSPATDDARSRSVSSRRSWPSNRPPSTRSTSCFKPTELDAAAGRSPQPFGVFAVRIVDDWWPGDRAGVS